MTERAVPIDTKAETGAGRIARLAAIASLVVLLLALLPLAAITLKVWRSPEPIVDLRL